MLKATRVVSALVTTEVGPCAEPDSLSTVELDAARGSRRVSVDESGTPVEGCEEWVAFPSPDSWDWADPRVDQAELTAPEVDDESG